MTKKNKTNSIISHLRAVKRKKEDDSVSINAAKEEKPSKIVKKKFRWPLSPKVTGILLVVVLLPVVLLSILGIYTYTKVKTIQAQVASTELLARETYNALKAQDLILANQKLGETKENIDKISAVYSQLKIYSYSPFRAYYLDGEHALGAAYAGIAAGRLMLDTIEPYADVLGFAGEGSFTEGTAEDRIVKIIETMDKVTPALDEVASHLTLVKQNLAEINGERYPFTIRGQNVAELIAQAQMWSDTAVVAVSDVKPLLEVLPSVAGLDEEKKYLVIFQNDAEIRPTGGFITAYGILRVDKGKVSQEKSEDIYALDEKFNSRIPAPAPILTYLDNINYWHLRDMNLSPDFKVSMDTFMEYYKTIPGEPAGEIDGIFAVDTQVLAALIEVLGPTEVPGFGTYTADIDPRCDCPQVIYELEDFATRPRAYLRDDRKSFLGPMLQTLLQKAYSSPNALWPRLFEVAVTKVLEKHVVFYMFDPAAQAAAEQVGVAGRIKDFSGDYLHISDTNLGGAKSNLFITEQVDLNVTSSDQGTENSLEVTYRNPAKASNCNLEAGQLCLNGIYRNWVRFYLPLGAELVESQGLEDGSVKVSEDLGKTVVEGFFKFAPLSQAKVRLVYKHDYAPTDEYQLLIQKQPGKKNTEYTVTFNQVDQEVFELKMDRELAFEI